MNKIFPCSNIIGYCLLLLATACSNTDEGSPNRSALLNKAPYADISDSIKKHPEQANLYLQRAALLSQNNLHELATPDFKKAWSLQHSDATGLEYASNLLLCNKVQEAATFLENCSREFPQNMEFRRRLSEVYAQQGLSDKAIAQYDSIIHTDPENFMAYYQKGMLQSKLKDTAGAIASLETSFRLQPLMYTGLELANMYAYRNNPRAVIICDELLKRDSAEGTTDASYIKGTYYFNSGQRDKAIRQFDETIRRDWKFINAYLDKGILLLEDKNYKEAMDVFSKAVLVDNSNPDAYYWLARTYDAMQKKEEAVENYERTLALDPKFKEARERLKALMP